MAPSPAASLSLVAIYMASNERVLMLVSQGWVMALRTGRRSQVQALALWKGAVKSCRLSPWTHSPLALSPQHGDNEKVGPLSSTPNR